MISENSLMHLSSLDNNVLHSNDNQELSRSGGGLAHHLKKSFFLLISNSPEVKHNFKKENGQSPFLKYLKYQEV